MDNTIVKHFQTFQNILIKYDSFSDVNSIWNGSFIYPSKNNAHLHALKDKYFLEKFVGSNDLDTAKNIMRWVNEIMLFSEYAEYKGNNTALEILNFSRENRKLLNCAMHSIVLTEALLSLGIISRSIQCLPLDPIDNDSHFINIVYINKMKKWIALDSAFSTYFTDKDENILNLHEIRNAYITNKLPKIHRYTRFSQSIGFNMDWYIVYLAKNLFRFSCTHSASFNEKSNIIYFLEPLGYRGDNLEIKTDDNINRYIGDEKYFWGNIHDCEK